MSDIVNRYCNTFVGQAAEGKWSFPFPMIPKKHTRNYFEIEVVQFGIQREGAASRDVLFFVADVGQGRSTIIDESSVIDSRINLGMLSDYNSGSDVAYSNSSSTIFRVDSLQPMNRFTVTQCRLSDQTGNTLVPDSDAVSSLSKLIMTWNITEMSPYELSKDYMINEPKPFNRF